MFENLRTAFREAVDNFKDEIGRGARWCSFSG